jgi:NAD(P) transhydrogenase subunit alpha
VRIGIPKETAHGETRVALTPGLIPLLANERHEVFIEKTSGRAASYSDEEYRKAGAVIVSDAPSVYEQAEVVMKVQPPNLVEAQTMKEGTAYIGFLAPLAHADVVAAFLRRRITGFSMEYIPRIARAQNMDALSSMATVAGYKSAVIAAEKMVKMFPLMMTAAGTIPPAIVLVLGAGVAGLQAIATARRLGAKVEAFDPRPAVREQVKSLGATFLDMEVTENVETADGYAREQSEEFLKKERDVITSRLSNTDAIICTAQVFGKRAPVLITAEMLTHLRPGTVIVDLAAEQGGNCELTVPGTTVERNGVTIVGAVNLPATLPAHASQMYAKNVANLFLHIYTKGSTMPDFEDEITKGCCITHNGTVVHETLKTALEQKGVITK